MTHTDLSTLSPFQAIQTARAEGQALSPMLQAQLNEAKREAQLQTMKTRQKAVMETRVTDLQAKEVKKIQAQTHQLQKYLQSSGAELQAACRGKASEALQQKLKFAKNDQLKEDTTVGSKSIGSNRYVTIPFPSHPLLALI
ncbi:hypothetical protein MFLO_13690 [Listeria floridensis FSL S10-1187]|uniref:Uncharacterized protein n=1 Tax=Listeria floridensis FSL S10-1187 TaxID=1265817 RepID=A0ABN0RC88_9LIST|nr:hypothetical protein [Listeria floridensis]EUJ26928.1 hypothetical protein MFLO_13690 [Listeria floridensis FSL S10-1187]